MAGVVWYRALPNAAAGLCLCRHYSILQGDRFFLMCSPQINRSARGFARPTAFPPAMLVRSSLACAQLRDATGARCGNLTVFGCWMSGVVVDCGGARTVGETRKKSSAGLRGIFTTTHTLISFRSVKRTLRNASTSLYCIRAKLFTPTQVPISKFPMHNSQVSAGAPHRFIRYPFSIRTSSSTAPSPPAQRRLIPNAPNSNQRVHSCASPIQHGCGGSRIEVRATRVKHRLSPARVASRSGDVQNGGGNERGRDP
ncbi:hypothetical protein DFJ77DRAFT_444122 [Powellomyces hirtus]|nr:hypothetical protein DFJ77DRAFT_444122 [Powellomyces hirtus]